MSNMPHIPEVRVTYPDWVAELVDWQHVYPDDTAKMQLAIAISRHNIRQGTGGPFGSAIFARDAGTLLAVGMNRVVPSCNSVLHGETIAFQFAQARLGAFTLRGVGNNGCELFTSCEPCAMCMGATLWSGVNRMVCAATGHDAAAIGFDEGPVFAQSWEYMEKAGIAITRNVCRDDANEVLQEYARMGGHIYNS